MKQKQVTTRLIILLIVVCAALVAMVAVVSPVLARYINKPDDVKNTLTEGDPSNPGVSDGTDGITVTVKEEDRKGYPVYVRATILITWQNADGDISHLRPVQDEDYELKFVNFADSACNWAEHTLGSGVYPYYFYKIPLNSVNNWTTSVLVTSFKRLESAIPPDNAFSILHIEIDVQSVQAVGTTDGTAPKDAYKDAWGIN